MGIFYVITELLQNLVGTFITSLLLFGAFAYNKMKNIKIQKRFI